MAFDSQTYGQARMPLVFPDRVLPKQLVLANTYYLIKQNAKSSGFLQVRLTFNNQANAAVFCNIALIDSVHNATDQDGLNAGNYDRMTKMPFKAYENIVAWDDITVGAGDFLYVSCDTATAVRVSADIRGQF